MMKNRLIVLSILALSLNVKAQSLYFPPLIGNKWDTISSATLGWCPDKIDTLFNYLESKNSKAFIVLIDGKIVLEKYFGTFTQDSAWYWASAGKTLTSFMVGMAQQENYLSIKDTTSKYIGQGWTTCTPAQEKKITIRHQLTMTSGLDDDVPDHHCTIDTCLNYLADAGTRWAYHNGPYTLLDSVIESATGQSVNSYFAKKIKNQIGMTGAFFPSGYNNVYYSTARSMARYGLMILNKGNWNGKQIMTDTAYFNQMVNTSQQLNKSYGYLWWLNGKKSYMQPSTQFVFSGSICPNAPNDMFAALGKNGQLINVVPSQNLVFIRMGDAPGVGEVPSSFNDTLWQKINALVCIPDAIRTIEDQSLEIRIYPNPMKQDGNITMQFADQNAGKYQVSLYNYLGQMVYNSSINKEEGIFIYQLPCQLNSLSTGNYHLEVVDENGIRFASQILLR